MKKHLRSGCLFFSAALLAACLGAHAWADEPAAESLDAFTKSYRQEKKAQRKGQILKGLNPSPKKDIQHSHEFVARSLYEEALLAFRHKEYESAKQELEQLRSHLSESVLSEKAKLKWSAKASGLSNKIDRQLDRLNQVKQKKQAARKREPKVKIVKPPTPVVKPVSAAPAVNTLKQDSVLELLKKRKQEIQFKRDAIQAEFNKGVAAMYDHAVERYQAKDYGLARIVFEDIQLLSPNYKDTGKYLKRLDRLPDQKVSVE